jgi:predicted NBD/HSP70 family sugar kinase
MSDEVTSQLKPQLLGRMTQRAVVEAIKTRGPMSRADIARLTGISPTTVSSAVNQVIRSGFIVERDAEITGPGRPGKILRFATEVTQVIGVSIEPEFCEVLVGGLDGQCISEKHHRFPTPSNYPQLLAEIERHTRDWMNQPNTRTLGVGLSLPGVVDPTGERSVFSPNLHQTDNQRPAHDLQERLGLPTVLIQESDALCLAERHKLQTEDLTVIDYSGGLGIGVIVGGRLLARHFGVPRELGHVTAILDGELCGCGNTGCLETVATDLAFARLVSKRYGQQLTIDEAITLEREKKIDVSAELYQVLDYLAVVVAAVANLFASPKIVLHGRLLDLRPNLMEQLTQLSAKRKLAPYRERCQLLKSTKRKAEGALAGVLDYLFEELGPLLPNSA